MLSTVIFEGTVSVTSLLLMATSMSEYAVVFSPSVRGSGGMILSLIQVGRRG